MGFRKSNGVCLRSRIGWGIMSNPIKRAMEWLSKWLGIGEHESDRTEVLDIIGVTLIGAAVGLNATAVFSIWTSTGRIDYEMFMWILELGSVETGGLLLAAIILKIWALNLRDSQPD